jgi:hypothetical protein
METRPGPRIRTFLSTLIAAGGAAAAGATGMVLTADTAKACFDEYTVVEPADNCDPCQSYSNPVDGCAYFEASDVFPEGACVGNGDYCSPD